MAQKAMKTEELMAKVRYALEDLLRECCCDEYDIVEIWHSLRDRIAVLKTHFLKNVTVE